MGKFQAKPFNLEEINNGNRFGNDGITPDAINAPIEASALMQSLATNQPNNSEISNIGTPKVEIEETAYGYRFKFLNLKGVGMNSVDYNGEWGTDKYILRFTFTDGTYKNVAVPKPKDGADGKDGANGRDGVDGKDGANGRDGVDGKDGAKGETGKGIKKTEMDANGNLSITYTDDTKDVFPLSNNKPTTMRSNSFLVFNEYETKVGDLLSAPPTVGVNENGDTEFKWDSLGIKVSSPNLIDIDSFSQGNLDLKQGEEITIYPFEEGSSKTWSYEFTINEISTRARIAYNETKYIEPQSWNYPPYRLRFEIENDSGVLTLIDKDEHVVAKATGVNFTLGVKIKMN